MKPTGKNIYRTTNSPKCRRYRKRPNHQADLPQRERDTRVRLNTGLLDAALEDALQELAYD